MAHQRHLEELQKGSESWNYWRAKHRRSTPNLRFAPLCNLNLPDVDLSGADLYGADLSGANLDSANLQGANLAEANLTGANLRFANLTYANLNGATLHDANFGNATVGWTIFSDVDLSKVKCLTRVRHYGPSSIGVETLYRSGGNLPPVFLRSCGLPDAFIDNLAQYINTQSAIEFYSCFISYNQTDEAFVRHLHSHLHEARIRVWFAPEDMNAGAKLKEQIDQAIRVYDKLLLVLSEHSLSSEWVKTEIRQAHQVERETNQHKLFPIRLVNMDMLRAWECFDANSGQDLAEEVRQYHIPDFSSWKNPDLFEQGLKQLLRALRQSQRQAAVPKPSTSC